VADTPAPVPQDTLDPLALYPDLSTCANVALYANQLPVWYWSVEMEALVISLKSTAQRRPAFAADTFRAARAIARAKRLSSGDMTDSLRNSSGSF